MWQKWKRMNVSENRSFILHRYQKGLHARGWFSVFCRANVVVTLRWFRRLGLSQKKEKKKIDRVYAPTTTRRPKDIPLVRNYDSHAERGSTKRLRGCRRDVAKVLTELSADSGSITRRESRQNFPAGLTHPRPSRCTERHSRIKTDYIPVSNGGDMFHPVAVICATQWPSRSGHHFRDRFREPRCVLVACWRSLN